MASFAHPNICLFMGACTQPGNFFIVQEFLTGGDVETLLREKNTQLSLYSRMLMAKGKPSYYVIRLTRFRSCKRDELVTPKQTVLYPPRLKNSQPYVPLFSSEPDFI
jgi:hypothetical protein